MQAFDVEAAPGRCETTSRAGTGDHMHSVVPKLWRCGGGSQPITAGTIVSIVRARRSWTPANVRAIPYPLWAHRGPGSMAVWLRSA